MLIIWILKKKGKKKLWFHKCGEKNLIPPRWHRHFLWLMEILFFFFLFFFRKFQKCLKSRKSRSQVKRRKGRNWTKKRSHGRAQGTCTVRCKYTATSNFCVRMDSSLLCFLSSFTFTATLSFLSVNAVFLALIGCIFLYFWGLVDIVVTSLYSSKEPHLFVVQLPFKPALSHITFCEVK